MFTACFYFYFRSFFFFFNDTATTEIYTFPYTTLFRSFIAVWRRPWMSLAADTYGSSLLDLLGVGNVFAGSIERYPETTLDEVATLAPNLIVLPSEPYPFAE